MTQFSSGAAWRQNTPSLLLRLAIGMTMAGLGTWAAWMWTGDWTPVTFFFRYPSPILTIAVCMAEVVLCWQVWRSFDETDAMRPAWMWLSLASIVHLTGRILGLPGSTAVPAGQFTSMNDIGRMVSGPLQMSLLFAGLATIVRVCWRLRLLRRLALIDYALLLIVAGFAARSLYGITQFVSAGKPVTFTTAVLWTSDPLLLSLLVMAVLLHRSAAELGRGLLANVWRSFAVAILLTSVGSASTWSVQGDLPFWTSLGWYVWFAVDCAYALAPAYQLAALQHARNRARVFAAFGEAAFWRLP